MTGGNKLSFSIKSVLVTFCSWSTATSRAKMSADILPRLICVYYWRPNSLVVQTSLPQRSTDLHKNCSTCIPRRSHEVQSFKRIDFAGVLLLEGLNRSV